MQRSRFDGSAADFDRFRALPEGVPEAIRATIWETLGGPSGRSLLDLGAGTGRVGAAFVAAGDSYVALDPSAGMLARFAEKAAALRMADPPLVQADGCALPFAGASFDAVLLVQVVSGAPGWRHLLNEARRVLRPRGAVVLGRVQAPPEGLDARMRAELRTILAALGVHAGRPGAGWDDVRAWLAPKVSRTADVVAAHWDVHRGPRDFLARHATGARFATLPSSLRDEALRRLADWAVHAFGSLDGVLVESHVFELAFFIS
jgi:ubiquinone/menaquinone biosynthesis C-methylase UbiE